MSTINPARARQFDVELGGLIQKFLNMSDADPLALARLLYRRAKEVEFIGQDERRRARAAGRTAE